MENEKIITERGKAPEVIIEGVDFLVPTYEIKPYPQIKYSKIKQRMLDFIDKSLDQPLD